MCLTIGASAAVVTGTLGHGTPLCQSSFYLSRGDSARAGEHWIINPTGWEVDLGLRQGGPRRGEILAWAPGGSSLSRVPWGLYSGPGGTSDILQSYDQQAMTTAGGGKPEKNRNSLQETFISKITSRSFGEYRDCLRQEKHSCVIL